MPEDTETTWVDDAPVADCTATEENGGRTVTVTVRGKEVSVIYDMRELTPRLLRKLEAGDGSLSTVREYVETLVTSWTLCDKRGIPVVLDENGIDGVAFGTLDAIASVIMADTYPNASEGAA